MQVTTEYKNNIDTLVEGQQNRLNNPYYKFTDKKPTIVNYWNINTKKSTLDEGRRDNYDQLGEKSPLRYNKINSFVLYGLPVFPVNMQLTEFGVESSSIEGEALVLPNTIIPNVDDYFTISYVSKPYIFRVNNVTIDTLENGSNFYIIQYHLDNSRDDYEGFLNSINLVNTFEFKIENIGTNKVCLLLSSDIELMNTLFSIYNTFRQFYIDLFYRQNIQTFVYAYLDMFVYDPYLIEFIIRNKLFSLEDDLYLYIDQAVHKPSTFSIEYEKSIFRSIEKRDSQFNTNSCYPVPVHDPNSLLMFRIEEYVELSINIRESRQEPINWLDNVLFDRICKNWIYNEEDEKNKLLYRNIIINYLNNKDSELNDIEIQSLLNLEMKYDKNLFYEIPILMYIIQAYINDMETKTNTYNNDKIEGMEECFSLGK